MLRKHERVTIQLITSLPLAERHGLEYGKKFSALRLENTNRHFPKWIVISECGERVTVFSDEATEIKAER